jgi:hypothetical protein
MVPPINEYPTPPAPVPDDVNYNLQHLRTYFDVAFAADAISDASNKDSTVVPPLRSDN